MENIHYKAGHQNIKVTSTMKSKQMIMYFENDIIVLFITLNLSVEMP